MFDDIIFWIKYGLKDKISELLKGRNYIVYGILLLFSIGGLFFVINLYNNGDKKKLESNEIVSQKNENKLIEKEDNLVSLSGSYGEIKEKENNKKKGIDKNESNKEKEKSNDNLREENKKEKKFVEPVKKEKKNAINLNVFSYKNYSGGIKRTSLKLLSKLFKSGKLKYNKKLELKQLSKLFNRKLDYIKYINTSKINFKQFVLEHKQRYIDEGLECYKVLGKKVCNPSEKKIQVRNLIFKQKDLNNILSKYNNKQNIAIVGTKEGKLIKVYKIKYVKKGRSLYIQLFYDYIRKIKRDKRTFYKLLLFIYNVDKIYGIKGINDIHKYDLYNNFIKYLGFKQ